MNQKMRLRKTCSKPFLFSSSIARARYVRKFLNLVAIFTFLQFVYKPVEAQSQTAALPAWLQEIEKVMKFVQLEDLTQRAVDHHFGTNFVSHPQATISDGLNSKFKLKTSSSTGARGGYYLPKCPNQSAQKIPEREEPRGAYPKSKLMVFPLPSPSFSGAARLISYDDRANSTYLVLPLAALPREGLENPDHLLRRNKNEIVRIAINSWDIDDTEFLISNRLNVLRQKTAYQHQEIEQLLTSYPAWQIVPNQSGLLSLHRASVANPKFGGSDNLLSQWAKLSVTNRDNDRYSPATLSWKSRAALLEAKYVNYDLFYKGKKGEWRISTRIVAEDRVSFKQERDCLERVVSFHSRTLLNSEASTSTSLFDLLVEIMRSRGALLANPVLASKLGLEVFPSQPIDGAAGIISYAARHPGLETPLGKSFGASQLLLQTPCMSVFDTLYAGSHWKQLGEHVGNRRCDDVKRLLFIAIPANSSRETGCIKESDFLVQIQNNTNFRRNASGFPSNELSSALGTVLIDNVARRVNFELNTEKPKDDSSYAPWHQRRWERSKGSVTGWFDKDCLVRFDFYSSLE
jgi:hypothetical protein